MLALSRDSVVRAEANGALFFNKKTAVTVLLDREGVAALVEALSGTRETNGPVRGDLRVLMESGFVVSAKNGDETAALALRSYLDSPPAAIPNSLSAPESLHIAVTDACDQSCVGCFYSKRAGRSGRFLSSRLYGRILNEAARVKVFQFAFGGGEPLLHPRLLSFVERAGEKGVVPNITTNGNGLTESMARRLRRSGLGQLQVSLDAADPALNSETRTNYAGAVRAIEICRKTGLRFGINALVTKRNFRDLPRLIDFARRAGAWGVNLLRPKPPALRREWLARTSLSPAENRALHRLLCRESGARGLSLTLDQSMTYLAYHRRPEELFRRGVWGCGAGRRFLSIDPEGIIYPCSHYRKRIARDGDFMKAWTSSALLGRFRNLEDEIHGACRSCRLVAVCRGCRAVVRALGGGFADADPHCPMLPNRP